MFCKSARPTNAFHGGDGKVRITDVEIEGFGAWSDLKLDHVSEGLTVFYGPNEAGKTTLMEFVRSVLYGYSAERRSRYLPPVAGGRGGGALDVVGAGGRFTIRRTPGSLTGDDLGRVEVLSPQGARQGQHVLGSLLSGIDEPIFNNVFAVGLRELQELGTLDDTEAAAHLYKLTSGLDRVSLIDVMRQLEAARNQILAADGSRSELTRTDRTARRLARGDQGIGRQRSSAGRNWPPNAPRCTRNWLGWTKTSTGWNAKRGPSRWRSRSAPIGSSAYRCRAEAGKTGPPRRVARAGGRTHRRHPGRDRRASRDGRTDPPPPPSDRRRGRAQPINRQIVDPCGPDRGPVRTRSVDRIAGNSGQAAARRVDELVSRRSAPSGNGWDWLPPRCPRSRRICRTAR
jgi:hypothetical protein